MEVEKAEADCMGHIDSMAGVRAGCVGREPAMVVIAERRRVVAVVVGVAVHLVCR